MSEATEPKARTRLLALKERRGPVSEQLLASIREGNATRTAIKKALASGPLTVPDLAEATGIPTRTVLWTITSMRKYGTVLEDSLDGSYPRYALAAKDPR